ncbi:MAG: hypothetical protein GYB31_08615 [Bacteroidetes bacterium]|nr:hypothetical protein [Bacteroidota bacterium]
MQFKLSSVSSIQIYNLIRFGSTIGVGICLTKIGLSTVEISIYEALLFLGNLFCFFWIGGGQSALLSLFPKLAEVDKKSLIFQAFVLFSLLGMITATLLLTLSGPIVKYLTQFEELPYVHWLALYIMLNVPSFLVHLYYLLLNQQKAIIRWGLMAFGGQLLVVVIPVWLTGDLEWSFIGLVFLAFVKYLWTLGIVWYHGSYRISVPILVRYCTLALPLILNLLIGNSTEYIDGLIVTSHFPDPGTFAVFRYGARELPLVTLIVSGLITALLPVVAGEENAGLAALRRRTAQFAHWLFPASAFLMLVSPWVFPFVYNDSFLDSAWVFNVYLLIIISRMLLPQVIIIGRDRSYILVRNAILETLLNVGLSLWLVREFGLTGIAFATVIAFFLAKANLIWFVWKSFRIPPAKYIPIRLFSGYSLILVLVYLLTLIIY